MLLAWTMAQAQEAAPGPEIATSAVSAVKSLGEQVVGGNLNHGFDRMLPRWRERLARRAGGEDTLKRQFQSAIDQLKKSGITFLSVTPTGAPQVYGVGAGKDTQMVEGKPTEVLITKQWLVLVPVISQMKIVDQQGKPHKIESKGFQVAVTDKGKNDWTFVDGASLTVEDLRSMFPTLPANLTLPEVSKKEIP